MLWSDCDVNVHFQLLLLLLLFWINILVVSANVPFNSDYRHLFNYEWK